MGFDAKEQRRIMGTFATGVTVVTTRTGDDLHGMTANAVTSLSLDPPLVLVAVDKESQSHQSIRGGNCFAVNILRDTQEEISQQFAQPGPKDFSSVPHRSGTTGAPILSDAIGYVDCQLREILPGGDHDIFVGEIVAGGTGEGEPLLYFGGKYRRLAD